MNKVRCCFIRSGPLKINTLSGSAVIAELEIVALINYLEEGVE